MKNLWRMFQMILIAFLLNLVPGLNIGYAQISWDIRVSPDVQKPIRPGPKLQNLRLEIVVSKSPDVTVQSADDLNPAWKLEGAGRLSNTRGSTILYFLPGEIIEELAIRDKAEKVTISVTIHNASGKSIDTKNIQFEIQASVQQLVKIAQGYFDNRCFMDTAGKVGRCRDTAVNTCKKILAIEADHPEVLSLLRKIRDFYKDWGDDAWKKREKVNVKKQYENYLKVVDYLPDSEVVQEKQDVQNKLTDLKMMEREKELREKLQRYRELQKQNGKNEAFLDVIMAIAKIFGETDIDSFHTRVDGMLRMERPKMGSSLQAFNDRFAQLHRDFDSSRKEKSQRKEIIQTLRIIATLRELKRVYEHFSPKEDLGALNNKIECYEERFLK